MNITATAKSGYRIKSGTGNTGTINSAKTVNVTSEVQGATVTITYTSGISGVTVNGTKVSSGWSGTIKEGDVIGVSGAGGSRDWYYNDTTSFRFGTGLYARCTAPQSSGSGKLFFSSGGGGSSGSKFYVSRRGACASWGWVCVKNV